MGQNEYNTLMGHWARARLEPALDRQSDHKQLVQFKEPDKNWVKQRKLGRRNLAKPTREEKKPWTQLHKADSTRWQWQLQLATVCGIDFLHLPLAQVVHELLHVDLVQQHKVLHAHLPLHGHFCCLFCSRDTNERRNEARAKECGVEHS